LVEGALDSAPLVVLSAMAKTTDALFRAGASCRGGAARRCSRRGRRRRAFASATRPRTLFEGSMPDELARELATHFGDLDRTLHGVALLRELTPRSRDAIAARGELLSTALFAAFCRASGIPAEGFDAREVMRTDARFGEAQPDAAAIRTLAAEKLGPRLGKGRAIVTQGYIGATADGSVTTLGRGGSDYSASLLGAGARLRRSADLDRRRGRVHGRSARRAVCASDRAAVVQRSGRASRLRREGAAPGDDPTRGRSAHPR
jgi:aspartate kinase